MKRINIFLIGGAMMLSVCSSCDSWLDVKPDNKVLEDDLLSNEEGFTTALNGIYLDMAAKDVYGKELSCGYIEALAQMYNIVQQTTGSSNPYLPFTQYNYKDKNVKGYFDRTWTAMYDLIANCNNLIEQAELRKAVFSSQSNYNALLSELYALRAFLHFDVYRLWGPVYSSSTLKVKCIPYYKSRVSLPEPLSTTEEVIENIFADLQVADSLAPEGTKTYKMNICKYAIQTLRARVCLYIGKKEAAYEAAKTLFDSKISNVYPFVKQTEAQNASLPDRLFYSEQIFVLENSKRNELYEDMFDYMLGEEPFLAPLLETVTKLFPNINDYRYGWWKINPGNGKAVSFVKFAKVANSNNPTRDRSQSLLKISELYLIMAECAPEEEVRIEYLDRLRVGRGYQEGAVGDAEKKDWEETIQNEYKREFYGEGQYFFFLKRKRIAAVAAGSGRGEWTMGDAQYIIPLPDSESLYR